MPITHKWDGTVLTITSDSGTSSADLKGQKGDDGARGAQGVAGSAIAEDTAKLGGIVADEYATKAYVDTAISNADIDLTPYATKDYADSKATAYNHLDNSYFVKPVNQRGQTTYNATGMSIDRWMIMEGQLVVKNGYIQTGFFQQFIPIGKTGVYTLAVKRTDGTILLHSQNIESSYTYTGTNVAFGAFDETRTRITIPGGEYLWVALYEGEYTAETLPPYVPKGYVVELAECRRYYKKEYINCWLEWFWTNSLRVAVNYEKMRIDNPTIKLVNAKFINTNLSKWEQWVWINLMPYYTAQENQTPQSVLFVFTDNDNSFIEKMSYQGMIEYEINADL